MASFNTYDYDFLVKCLVEGSISFKVESIKRLTFLAQNDKKQFSLNSKQILQSMQQLYSEQKQDLNILVTLMLSQIILNVISKQNEQLIKSNHLKSLIWNLGHPSKPTIRKASHTSILAYVKIYHNFDAMLEEYLLAGFDHANLLIKQKAINSFQSIFILEVKYFQWDSESSKNLLQNLVLKAGDDNFPIAKAAAQCLLSLCKHADIKKTTSLLSIGFLQKFNQFLATTQTKLPNAELQIKTEDVNNLIENFRRKPKVQKNIQEPQRVEQRAEKAAEQIPSEFKTLQVSAQNITYQRRLQKIKKTIINSEQKQKKVEKQQNQGGLNLVKMFSNIANQSSIKQRTQAVEDILYKIQLNKNKPQFEGSIKSVLPQVLKLLKDPNPKIVGLTLKILQSIAQQLKSSDVHLQNLISVIIQKLGDQKISIRQIVSKVIRELINKTQRGLWIKQILQNLKKNNNTFFKDQSLNLILCIYEQNPIQSINYPIDEVIDKIVVFTDDPKTKIKIRTLDCLAQIVAKSGRVQQNNQKLKKQMSQVFYQMYVQKVNKLLMQSEKKKVQQLQKKRKTDDLGSFRSTYQQRNSYKKQQSDDDKLNISMDVVKKRVSNLRSKKTMLSIRQTSSLDKTYHKTMDRSEIDNIEEDQMILPSLDKKTIPNNRVVSKRKAQSISMKTIDNKNSDYMSKQELKPLSEPDKQFKNIMCDLKSGDWKVQFQSTNKLRRLIQFNPQLILSASSANLHMIIIDLLSLIQSLRSSVSKNALIALNQIIQALGKQVDPQMQAILEKLMKKSIDTNVFISSEVQKCLKTLSLTATPTKMLQKLTVYKDSKNFAIKDAFINTLLVMKDQQKIRSKQYGKLAEIMSLFLSEGQIDLRSKAKTGITDICNHLGDWYRFLRGKVSPSAFKLICDVITRNSMNSTIKGVQQTVFTPVKTRKQAVPQQQNVALSSIIKQKIDYERKQQTRSEIKRQFGRAQQFPNEFGEIAGLIELSSSSEWKKRIQSSQGLKLLALRFPEQFMLHRSSCHLMDILSKQICEPNLKVSVNAMQIFIQLMKPLKKLVQSNLSVICNSIFNALSNSKIQVKQMAQKCFQSLIQSTQIQLLLPHLCHGSLYCLPRSRTQLFNKIKDKVQDIYNNRRQLMFKHIFPLLNKLMDEYKAEMMPHVVNFFILLYEIMGNNLFSHVTKFKEVRELIGR